MKFMVAFLAALTSAALVLPTVSQAEALAPAAASVERIG